MVTHRLSDLVLRTVLSLTGKAYIDAYINVYYTCIHVYASVYHITGGASRGKGGLLTPSIGVYMCVYSSSCMQYTVMGVCPGGVGVDV